MREITAQLKNLKQLESKKGYEFRALKRRIQSIGSSDYSMKRAITYMNNYIKEMSKYSHFDNYDKLIKAFKRHSNPISFYKFMSKNELTKDLTYQSDQYFTQEAFNSYIQDLGIKIEE